MALACCKACGLVWRCGRATGGTLEGAHQSAIGHTLRVLYLWQAEGMWRQPLSWELTSEGCYESMVWSVMGSAFAGGSTGCACRRLGDYEPSFQNKNTNLPIDGLHWLANKPPFMPGKLAWPSNSHVLRMEARAAVCDIVW